MVPVLGDVAVVDEVADIESSAVHPQHQEVILMSVKLMVLQRPVLDSPVLDCTQRGHDAGRIVGVEERGRGPRP